LKEAEEKVQTEEDKIQEIETRNEKYSVDHRTLEVYRQEVTELLDDVCSLLYIYHTFSLLMLL
jgi:hypothetical protein